MFLNLLLLAICTLPTASGTDVSNVVAAELAKLPGHTGFAFCELTPDGPQLLYGVRQDERFAVGSSFKLFILGTLINEVNEDRRSSEDIMRLRADLQGPPHSEMAGWPVGSPVTLHTLALKMISISDNTATDHLLHLLGRETIEKQMDAMIARTRDLRVGMGTLVQTISPGGIRQPLRRQGRLWFVPDGSIYVYYTPMFWRRRADEPP